MENITWSSKTENRKVCLAFGVDLYLSFNFYICYSDFSVFDPMLYFTSFSIKFFYEWVKGLTMRVLRFKYSLTRNFF